MSWYKDWFNLDYLRVYGHRDDQGAAREVEFLLASLGTNPRSVLDVGCGTGRHLQELARSIPLAVGADLSAALLGEAREREYPERADLLLVRADMRTLPFRSESFELLTNLFTGFGYFETDDENAAVAGEWARVVRLGGQLFLDYLNPGPLFRKTESAPVISERKIADESGATVSILEERSISPDRKRIIKRISIARGAEIKDYHESVRLYERDELITLFVAAGFELQKNFGDLSGNPWSESAPRTVLLFERAR